MVVPILDRAVRLGLCAMGVSGASLKSAPGVASKSTLSEGREISRWVPLEKEEMSGWFIPETHESHETLARQCIEGFRQPS